MFTPSNMLLNSLNAQPRDIFDIIGALMGYINADPQFKTNDFEQAVRYVLNQGVAREELFAPFDGEIYFEENPAKWDNEYYSYARVYLKDNFCEKRISHVKAVARKIYPAGATVPKAEAPVSGKQTTVSGQNGGSQSIEKKTQSQQHRMDRKSQKPSVSKAKIAVVAVVVLLAVVIGCIVKGCL